MINKHILSIVILSKQKNDLIEEYLKLSYRLSDVIQGNFIEEIESVLTQRDQIINNVDQVDAQLQELINNIEGGKDKSTAPQLQQHWIQLKEEIECMLATAKDVEDTNRLRLMEKKELLAAKLKTVREGKKGLAVYEGKNTHIEGIFLDKKR